LNFRYGDWSEGFYKNLINGIILHGYLRWNHLNIISKKKA
jgi:hypothetical protein